MRTLKIYLLSICTMLFVVKSYAADIQVVSPDGKTQLQVQLRDKLNFAVVQNAEYQLLPTTISMTLANGVILGDKPELVAQKQLSVNNNLMSLYGQRSTIPDVYNELTIDLKDKSRVIFRVYNDAVAYRWVTNIPGEIIVTDEEMTARFNHAISGWMPNVQSYETSYTYKQTGDGEMNRDLFLPLVIDGNQQSKLVFTEADVVDYPSLFLRKSNDVENRLVSSFQKYPKSTAPGGYNLYNRVVTETENYIAKTKGTRSFPWRIVYLASDDKMLIANDIVYRLAHQAVTQDFSWVKPGKVVWDWWADYVIEGVDFKTGINTATYLKHIDFAAQNKIEYIIIDWKWTDRDDVTILNPEVDAPKIIAYGKEKGVKVIVWTPSYTLYRQLNQGLDMIAAMGAAGIKVDFFDRDDQQAIVMYEAIAKAAADRKLVVDFHGCTKPSGLERKYPNVINYEAVLGNEVNKWASDITPEHKVNLAFIRNFAGPMDFTPGGMRNVNRSEFVSRNTLPMVQDTRCAEMALYVVFYEPLKMFCDAASTYAKEQECFGFLTAIPTVWDETRVLDAKVGDYVVIARRSGKTWYVAGITDYSERQLQLDLSFIGGSKTVESFTDGVNTSHVATDYQHRTQKVDLSKPMSVTMVSGGGFICKISE